MCIQFRSDRRPDRPRAARVRLPLPSAKRHHTHSQDVLAAWVRTRLLSHRYTREGGRCEERRSCYGQRVIFLAACAAHVHLFEVVAFRDEQRTTGNPRGFIPWSRDDFLLHYLIGHVAKPRCAVLVERCTEFFRIVLNRLIAARRCAGMRRMQNDCLPNSGQDQPRKQSCLRNASRTVRRHHVVRHRAVMRTLRQCSETLNLQARLLSPRSRAPVRPM